MFKKVRTQATNVLIIGSGAAGLRAAIAAHQENVEVLILGKRHKKDAHTVLAAGGINAALATVDKEDTWQQHFVDTIKEGYELSDPKAVEILCQEAPSAVKELASWGCPFDRLDNKALSQRYFGAHKYRRTCYAGDWTGRAILYTLVDQVERLGIRFQEHEHVWSLLANGKQCVGAVSFNLYSGEIQIHQADTVILAAGGHTRLWKKSSSRRDENTGDGMYLALNVGAILSDMELVQFHPTGMTHPDDWIGTLVTEAVRGEGGHLYNSKGERFMKKYDSDRMELSTRDRVALANYNEIMEGRGGPNGGVFLDVSHIEKEKILRKLPRMYRQFIQAQNIDISKTAMEVSPTAHYSMGGVMVDPKTHETQIKGLYAAGEVTSGVHGANRLGGNSLVETIVFGKIVGKEAAIRSQNISLQQRFPDQVEAAIEELNNYIKNGHYFVRQLQRELRDIMWKHCGVYRTEELLKEGLKKIESLEEKSLDVDVRANIEGFQDVSNFLDFKASIESAKITLLGALKRQESRGSHQRKDYPKKDNKFKININFHKKNGELIQTTTEVQKMSLSLEKLYKKSSDITIKGRLLE